MSDEYVPGDEAAFDNELRARQAEHAPLQALRALCRTGPRQVPPHALATVLGLSLEALSDLAASLTGEVCAPSDPEVAPCPEFYLLQPAPATRGVAPARSSATIAWILSELLRTGDVGFTRAQLDQLLGRAASEEDARLAEALVDLTEELEGDLLLAADLATGYPPFPPRPQPEQPVLDALRKLGLAAHFVPGCRPRHLRNLSRSQ